MKRLIQITAIVFSVSVFFVIPAFAEFYQYKDANGVLHVTDDLSDVPDNPRLDIKEVREIPLEKLDTEQTGQKTASLNNDNTVPPPGTWEGELQIKAETLKNEEASLKQIHADLQSEKQDLGGPPPASASHRELRDYQARAEALNRKIVDYDERRKQFEKKVEEFNAGIKGPR